MITPWDATIEAIFKNQSFLEADKESVASIILMLSGETEENIISELLDCTLYQDNASLFFEFFGWQGGTIHQLAQAISKYKAV